MSSLNSLLICGLQVTLVATVGLTISLIARRWLRTSATLPLAATLAAVVLLTVCAFSSWPSWLQRPTGPETTLGASQTAPPEFATDPSLNPYMEHLTQTPWGSVSLPPWMDSILYGSGTVEVSEKRAFGDSAATQHWTAAHWLYLFIGGAILFGLIRVIGGLWAVRHFVRTSRPLNSPELLEQVDLLRAEMGCRSPVEIRECPHLATAATVGWRHPVILLSESWQTWTETQLRSVLAHEIAHITRGDFLATVAAQVGVVLHFYHPLVHWLANRLRLEQELAADALAAQVVGGSRAYLNAIGELALKQTEEPVGWPAHPFLPTRRTFLRRIEMLRDLKFLSGSAPRLVRWATLASVAAVTLVAIGLRPPGGDDVSPLNVQAASPVVAAVAIAEATAVQTPAVTEALEAKYIPADAFAVIVARPETLNQQFQKLKAAKLLPADVLNPLDEIANCESASVYLVLPPNGGSLPGRSLGMCITFANRNARDVMFQKMVRPQLTAIGYTWQKKKFLLFEYEVLAGPGEDSLPGESGECRHIVDDRTILFAGSQEVLKKMLLNGPKSLSPLTQTESWKVATNGTVAVAMDAVGLQKLMAIDPPNPIAGLFSPLWASAVSHTLSLNVGDKTQLALTSQAKDAASSQQIEATLKAGIAMLSNMLNQAKSSPEPNMKKIVEGVMPILKGHKIATQGNETTLTCEADLTGVMALLAEPISQARAAAQRQQQQNNLQQIMLALHNYHDTYTHFPPAVVIDPQSKVARSWRVELLPFLNQQGLLYGQYKKDEPWDSENNKKVLAQMPAIFRHPSQPANSTNTAFVAAYGKGLFFEENATKGTEFRDITDGTSITIGIVEAKTETPWTKPEDITVDLTQVNLPEFGGFEEGVFQVGMCDGSVRAISKSIDITLLRKLFTKAGGEVIEGF